MAAEPAHLLSETSAQSLRLGVTISTVERVYQVITDNEADASDVVLNAPSLPRMRTGFIYDGSFVWCIARKPQRIDTSESRRKWAVNCTFTDDPNAFAHDDAGVPVGNPESITPTIEIDYFKREEPITDASFQSITNGPFHEAHAPVADDPFKVDPDKLLTPPPWLPRVTGPITNSAGDVRYATAPRYNRRIRLTKYIRTWDDALFDYLGAVNDAEVVVRQFDGNIGTGVPGDPSLRYYATFPALTLKVADIKKKDIRLPGKLYFAAVFDIEENKTTWVHSELDSGQRMRVFEGQDKIEGGQYTKEELASLQPPIDEYGFLPIIQNGVAVSDRAKLNGYGAPLPIIRDPNAQAVLEDGNCAYVNFRVGDLIDYSDLGFE